MQKIGIIGSDKRYEYLKHSLNARLVSNEKITEKFIESSDIIILPIPLSRDNITLNYPIQNTLLKPLLKKCRNKRVFAGAVSNELLLDFPNITDFAKSESFLYKNAVLTAESTVSFIIENSDKCLFNSNVLILGFGRISQILSVYLSAMHCKITIAARREKARQNAVAMGYNSTETKNICLNGYDYIINTVPAVILDEKALLSADKDVLITELASTPGGVDFTAADRLGISAKKALSLPSKYCAVAASKIIYDEISHHLQGNDLYE